MILWREWCSSSQYGPCEPDTPFLTSVHLLGCIIIDITMENLFSKRSWWSQETFLKYYWKKPYICITWISMSYDFFGTLESSVLNLAYLYTSDAFIYVQKCLFMFQCSQAAYFVWGCTKSKLQSSNPQDRNWLTGGYGNKQLSNRFEPNFYIEDQKSRCSSQPLW